MKTFAFSFALFLLLGRTNTIDAVPLAELEVLPTVDSSDLHVQHEFLTECDGKMYYTAMATATKSNKDGLYWYDGDADESKLVLENSLGKIRGLMCHKKYLYYFKRVIDQDEDKGISWALYRYKEGDVYDSLLEMADQLSHDPPTPYEDDLYIGGQGPKLYKLTTGTDAPIMGVVWSTEQHNEEVYPEQLTVHKGEGRPDLYYVAPDDKNDNHMTLWKFNVHDDEAEVLSDLALRTGQSEGTCYDLISFKNSGEYTGSLYMSLGPFAQNDGRFRLAKWDGAKMPVFKQIKDLDPSHLTIYQDSLYMSLRDVEDASKYALWKWDGRYVRQVATLPDEGKIHRVMVWKTDALADNDDEDILVMAGNNGPLVVWNGDDTSTVTITTNLFDVKEMVSFRNKLLFTASEKSDVLDNKIWTLTKGIFSTATSSKSVTSGGGISTGGGSDSGSGNAGGAEDEDDTEDTDTSDDSSGSLQPSWSTKMEGSGNGGRKAFLWLFFLFFFGGLGWWIYKQYYAGNYGIERLESFNSDAAYDVSQKEVSYDDDDGNQGSYTDKHDANNGNDGKCNDADEGNGIMV